MPPVLFESERVENQNNPSIPYEFHTVCKFSQIETTIRFIIVSEFVLILANNIG